MESAWLGLTVRFTTDTKTGGRCHMIWIRYDPRARSLQLVRIARPRLLRRSNPARDYGPELTLTHTFAFFHLMERVHGKCHTTMPLRWRITSFPICRHVMPYLRIHHLGMVQWIAVGY